jgi:hypothetical protein
MIIRNKRGIYTDSEEITLQVGYGIPDVRAWVESFFSLIGMIEFEIADLEYYLKHSSLKHFSDKWKDKICEWAITAAQRHEFILRVNDTDDRYIISSKNTLKHSGGDRT